MVVKGPPEYSGQAKAIPWLLMRWFLPLPDHRQPWHCQYKMDGPCLPQTRISRVQLVALFRLKWRCTFPSLWPLVCYMKRQNSVTFHHLDMCIMLRIKKSAQVVHKVELSLRSYELLSTRSGIVHRLYSPNFIGLWTNIADIVPTSPFATSMDCLPRRCWNWNIDMLQLQRCQSSDNMVIIYCLVLVTQHSYQK